MKTLLTSFIHEHYGTGLRVILPAVVFSLTLTFLPNYAKGQAPTNGLLAYYPLDANAHDASGNNYNGTEFNGVTYTPHLGGLAAHFAGSAYISLPTTIPSGSSVSVTFWVR